jgi:hypothetical protein
MLMSNVALAVILILHPAMLIQDAHGATSAIAQNTAAVMQGVLQPVHAVHTAGKGNALQHATTQTADALQQHSAAAQSTRQEHGHALMQHVHAHMVLGLRAHAASQNQTVVQRAELSATAHHHTALLIQKRCITTQHARAAAHALIQQLIAHQGFRNATALEDTDGTILYAMQQN